MNNTCSADKPYLGWFAKICSIPHESKHERQLSDYLVTFANERGLAVRQDEAGNILIRRGSSGTHGHGVREGQRP